MDITNNLLVSRSFVDRIGAFMVLEALCRYHESPVSALVVFFFQAEDGIRDVAVTGVQTCALPILELYRSSASDENVCPSTHSLPDTNRNVPRSIFFAHPGTCLSSNAIPASTASFIRSEERRVGKECRSRWAPEYWTKHACKRAGQS